MSRVIFMTHPLSSLAGLLGDAESMGRISDVGIVTVAVRWPDIPFVIFPGTRSDDVRAAVASEPC